MIAVTIYTRPGCHLCDEMKALLTSVSRAIPLSIEEIDIYADDELEELYGLEIPVLFVEGEKNRGGPDCRGRARQDSDESRPLEATLVRLEAGHYISTYP